MRVYKIVLDTNVIFSGLFSIIGYSFQLLSLIKRNIFKIHISVPLSLEYEDVLNREKPKLDLSKVDIKTFIDSICSVSEKHEIFYLWRPFLKVEHFIELAVTEKVSALSTLDYLEKRTHSGSLGKLDKILAKVPSREPLDFDRIK